MLSGRLAAAATRLAGLADAVGLGKPADAVGAGGVTGVSGAGTLPASTEAAAADCGDHPVPVQYV